MNPAPLAELQNEPPDALTFGAVCAVLDRMSRSGAAQYEAAVAAATELVARIPVDQCRLPFWPDDAAGQMVAARSGFWPILRSLGFERSGEFDWFPNVVASAFPHDVPASLAELALYADDPAAARAFLGASRLDRLVLVPAFDGDRHGLLAALPPTLRKLDWCWSVRDAANPGSPGLWDMIRVPIRSIRVQAAMIDEFRAFLAGAPPSVRELDPCLFLGDGDRIAELCSGPIAGQLERLLLTHSPVGDGRAAALAHADFPCLEALHMAVSQPMTVLKPERLTSAGAEALARARWWQYLKDLSLSNVYSDAVVAPLLRACGTRLKTLRIAQDSPYENPHAEKVGVSDAGLSCLAPSVVAGLDELSLINTQIHGEALRRWATGWPAGGRGPRRLILRSNPCTDFDGLVAFLSSPAVGSVEELELSSPDFQTGRAGDIATALVSSPFLTRLRVLRLPGWDIDHRRLGQVGASPTLSQSLRELQLHLSEAVDDSGDLEAALAAFFVGPVGQQLRSVAFDVSPSPDLLCRVFERLSVGLPKLRALCIRGEDFNITSVGRLARAECLAGLWTLRLESSWGGSRSATHPVGDGQPDDVLALATSRPLRNLYKLEMKNIGGFGAPEIEHIRDSALVSELLELPEMYQYRDAWAESEVLCPLARGVLDSWARTAANSDDEGQLRASDGSE